MFFSMIISCTCDICVELKILKLMNILKSSRINESFPLKPCGPKFQAFEILIYIFPSSSPNEHIFT
jgi:hypothetical protein